MTPSELSRKALNPMTSVPITQRRKVTDRQRVRRWKTEAETTMMGPQHQKPLAERPTLGRKRSHHAQGWGKLGWR